MTPDESAVSRFPPERTILHIDMNAFFASVEQAADPRLRGKPVAVCGNPDTRTTVAAASYDARPFGVKAGMSVGEAKRLCPDLILVPGDPTKYVSTSVQLLEIFRQYTPLVEMFSIDEAFLDVTGSQHLFGGAESLARSIKRDIREKFGLTCSVGVAPNKLLAKLASDMQKPDGLTIIRAEDVPEVMKRTPVSDLCGIGPKTTELLKAMGVTHCADVLKYPERFWSERLGFWGRMIYRMARGEDASPVTPYGSGVIVKSMGHSYTLPEDTYDMAFVRSVLRRLSEQAARRMRAGRYQGRTVTLILRYSDFSTFSRQTTLPTFIDDGEDVYRAALRILESSDIFKPSKAIRLVGVSVSKLRRSGCAIPLLEDAKRKRRKLSAIDRINDKYGEFTVFPAQLLIERRRKRPPKKSHGFLFKNSGPVPA